MTNSKFIRIALIVLSAMILIGVALTVYMLSTANNRNIIKVNIENGKTQAVEFKDLCLLPGEECGYIISFGSGAADKYDVELVFHETEGEKTLKDHAYVRIEANGEVICDQLLATLFENSHITLPIDLTGDEKNDVKIVYYLPEEVGNEVQNAEATFELLITASNE